MNKETYAERRRNREWRAINPGSNERRMTIEEYDSDYRFKRVSGVCLTAIGVAFAVGVAALVIGYSLSWGRVYPVGFWSCLFVWIGLALLAISVIGFTATLIWEAVRAGYGRSAFVICLCVAAVIALIPLLHGSILGNWLEAFLGRGRD